MSLPAQGLDLSRHLGAGELGVRDVELSVQVQSIGEIACTRRQIKLGVKHNRSGHGRLVRFDGQAQQVFESTLVHSEVESDQPTFLVGRFDDPTLGNDDRVQEMADNRVQQGVSVSTIDRCTESRIERHRMATNRYGEIGSRSLPLDFNLLQHAAKLSPRRQNSTDPLKHAQISVVEGVLGRKRGLTRIVGTPGTEIALAVDLSRWNRVGKLRAKGRGPIKPHGMHDQMMDRKHVGILVRRLGQQTKFGIVGHNLMNQDWHVPRLRPILFPALRRRRYLYD